MKRYCRDHAVFIPKYRETAIFGTLRRERVTLSGEKRRQEQMRLEGLWPIAPSEGFHRTTR